MLASSCKRVDDVMVIVQGNWEFGEGEDPLDPVPRQKSEPGGRNNLKKVLASADDVVLQQIKTTLEFFSHPNLQKQGRAAHILSEPLSPVHTDFPPAPVKVESSPALVKETEQVIVDESAAGQSDDRLAEQRGEKCLAEFGVNSSDNLVDK
ncbi:hypothetical protein CsSME_00022083 [Camellia sinensis var. sinensis]